jgi:hypothetical protein
MERRGARAVRGSRGEVHAGAGPNVIAAARATGIPGVSAFELPDHRRRARWTVEDANAQIGAICALSGAASCPLF